MNGTNSIHSTCINSLVSGAVVSNRELALKAKAAKGPRQPLKGTPPVIGRQPLTIGSMKDQGTKLELNAVVLKDVPWIKYKDGKKTAEMTIDSGAAATVAPRWLSTTILLKLAELKLKSSQLQADIECQITGNSALELCRVEVLG